jgi:Tfp pilus assembly ATPase PilU
MSGAFDQAILDLYRRGVIAKAEAINNADSHHNLTVQIRLMDNQSQPQITKPMDYDTGR